MSDIKLHRFYSTNQAYYVDDAETGQCLGIVWRRGPRRWYSDDEGSIRHRTRRDAAQAVRGSYLTRKAAQDNRRTFVLKIECRQCNHAWPISVDPADYDRWGRQGHPIQDCMPYLTADQRELLISNTCGTCFDELADDLESEAL